MLLFIALTVRIILQLVDWREYSTAISGLDFCICFKFYNISKYDQVLKFYYLRRESLALFEFAKYLIMLAFLCHVSACGFVLLDVALMETGIYPSS